MHHPLTIIVDAAIIVLVAILHELLNVILCDGLAGSLKHHLQLVQVNVAISISAGSGGKGGLRASGGGQGGEEAALPTTQGGRQAEQGSW